MRSPPIIRQRAPCNDARTPRTLNPPCTPTDHPMDNRAPQSHVHGMPCTLNSPCAPMDHPMDGRAPQSYVHGMPCTLNPPCAARRMPRTLNPPLRPLCALCAR